MGENKQRELLAMTVVMVVVVAVAIVGPCIKCCGSQKSDYVIEYLTEYQSINTNVYSAHQGFLVLHTYPHKFRTFVLEMYTTVGV